MNRSIFQAAFAAALTLALPAFAQAPSPKTATQPAPPPVAEPDPTLPAQSSPSSPAPAAGASVGASANTSASAAVNLSTGMSVKDSTGAIIGEVTDLKTDASGKKVATIKMGADTFAVETGRLGVQDGAATVNATQAELEAMLKK